MMRDDDYRQRMEKKKEGRRIFKHRPRRMKRKESKIIMIRGSKKTKQQGGRGIAHTKE